MFVCCSNYLAGCAVGDAGLAIGTQVEVGRASTLEATSWRQQAQVAATTVVDFAGMVRNWTGKRKKAQVTAIEVTHALLSSVEIDGGPLSCARILSKYHNQLST